LDERAGERRPLCAGPSPSPPLRVNSPPLAVKKPVRIRVWSRSETACLLFLSEQKAAELESVYEEILSMLATMGNHPEKWCL